MEELITLIDPSSIQKNEIEEKGLHRELTLSMIYPATGLF